MSSLMDKTEKSPLKTRVSKPQFESHQVCLVSKSDVGIQHKLSK